MTACHRLAAALIALPFSALLAASTAAASPCTAPAEYVRAGAAQQPSRVPLLRPYVVQGIAVIAVHQREGGSWLELAVDSESSARQALRPGSARSAQGGEIVRADDAVLLSCQALAHGAPAQRIATLSTPLW